MLLNTLSNDSWTSFIVHMLIGNSYCIGLLVGTIGAFTPIHNGWRDAKEWKNVGVFYSILEKQFLKCVQRSISSFKEETRYKSKTLDCVSPLTMIRSLIFQHRLGQTSPKLLAYLWPYGYHLKVWWKLTPNYWLNQQPLLLKLFSTDVPC